ncbi:hypothetical protein KAJ27_11515, partial [bacterium]|nr:hypothetical protein [bacterium]
DYSVDSEYIRQESLQELQESIATLKPIYQEVILLLYDGYTHREIAEISGLSINTILSRSHRGAN